MIFSNLLLPLGYIIICTVVSHPKNISKITIPNSTEITLEVESSSSSNEQINEQSYSELTIFMPSLDASSFIYSLLAYLSWKCFVKSKPDGSHDDHYDDAFYNGHSQPLNNNYLSENNSQIIEFLDLDQESISGNWVAVEKGIRSGATPSTKVVCRAYSANQYKLVSDILNQKDKIRFEPDISVILLHRSCKLLVDKMIAENHIKYIDGRLLNLACRYGHLSLVKYILEMKKMKINKSHLDLAILSGNYHLVSFFIEKLNMTPGSDGIEIACYSRNIYLIKYLERRFGDIFDYPSLKAVIFDWQVLRYFVQEKEYPTSHFMFKQTALYGFFESFDFLEKYYTFEADTDTLDYACFSGNLQFVKHLVERRNIKPNLFNLDAAAINGQLNIVRYLINERNITHDHLVERMAETSNNKKLIAFLKTKKPRTYNWFYLWEYYWFRRWFHSNLFKHKRVTFSVHKAELKRLLIV